MAETETSVWRGLRARLKGPTVQGWVVEANDGIIATAGLLEGFAGLGSALSSLAGGIGDVIPDGDVLDGCDVGCIDF